LYLITVVINDLYQAQPAVTAQVGQLTIVDLLQPLLYTLNSSFMAAFCDLDLQKEFGMHQYEVLYINIPPKGVD
jgi:hypothetical protein